jgi:hypothetical protein
MKKRSADEEFDRILWAMVADSGASDDDIRAVTDSPSTWWGIQRQIASPSAAQKPWPPSVFIRRLLAFGIPSAALAALLLFVLFRSGGVAPDVQPTAMTDGSANAPGFNEARSADPEIQVEQKIPASVARTEGRRAFPRPRGRSTPVRGAVKPESEIRSDFIALSYADTPESGQVVRVKVPRSMMVSLGLVAAVERPTGLIDAEMVIGDDGRTHAIRFIH